jgi:hypothetical protein
MVDATVDQVRRYALGRIAGLVRPGGWIIAHEPLATPPPRSLPHLGALETYWDLLHEVMERAGVPRGTAERLPRSAREAGIAAEMIDDVVAILRAAKAGGYEWVTSPFLLDLVLRKPQAPGDVTP